MVRIDYIKISNNKVYAAYIAMNGSILFDIDITSLLLDGGWHMLTITKASNGHKLYIDGTYIANGSWSTSSTNSSSAPFLIGNGFSGKMDNLRVYNRAISQTEINQIFAAKQ